MKVLACAVFVLSVAACGGGDGDDDTAAADWCERTEYALRAVDTGYAPPIDLDTAGLWMESAPDDVRASTDRAARFLSEIRSSPFPPDFTEAREEIEAYAMEHCPRGIGDGGGA